MLPFCCFLMLFKVFIFKRKKRRFILLNSLINKVIRKIRFHLRFRFSESVKSASNFDADKTDLLRKNADENGFYFLKA